ncbi:MAG: hypothetical protein HQL40_03595, partial [Alphaproteobacteria bacterium]|nr:hypothetical protein [Alphaproteobacteria bacterium]
TPPQGGGGDRAEALAALTRLDERLALNDLAAGEEVDAVRRHLAGGHAELVGALSDQVAGLDFASASETADRLRATLLQG